LSGSKSHNSALVLRFNGKGDQLVTTLLLPDVNPKEEIWEGPQMKSDEACDVFGVDHALHMEDLTLFLHNQIMHHCGDVKNLILWYDYLNPTHDGIHRTVMRLIEGSQMAIQPVQSPRMAVQRQRLLKSRQEIEAMSKAAQISAGAINSAMKTTLEHNSETKLFAKLDYESQIKGADFLAYPPVVACGDNANIIHYTRYSKNEYDKSDLVLVDCGCDIGGYASDITRTWPLSGNFSRPQKLIYQVVLDIQRQLLSALSNNAGNITVDHLYKLMQEALGRHLLNIGLLPEDLANDSFKLNEAASEFCPHHVSHYLGMDVHDTALISRNIKLQAGMVITVEPGIYIPRSPRHNNKYLSKVPDQFKGIGVRIEDDVLITSASTDRSGKLSCEILSKSSPTCVEEIENLVNS